MRRVVRGRHHDRVRRGGGDVIERVQAPFDDPVDQPVRKPQIALVRQHDAAAEAAADQREKRRLELGHVDVDHVAPRDERRGIGGKERHDGALAELNETAHDLTPSTSVRSAVEKRDVSTVTACPRRARPRASRSA
jgi:hypothetical protein